ncbi:Protoporphyrinogen oxidase [compost metagenome]
MRTIAIVGGGITGLSAAYYLQKHIIDRKWTARIVLIEANDYLGGKINTVHRNGFAMETGADSLVARKSNVAPLIDELGLRDQVEYNATGKSYIFTEGQLKLIPEDAVFGIPLSIESLAKSDLVSAEGKVEALRDFYTTNETFTLNDSIGLFLEAFLGKEIVDKQIAPVLSGVYSGKLNDLTIASTLPYLLEYKNEYGSIIKGLAENKATFKKTGNKKFLSFKEGTSALIHGLEQHLLSGETVEIIKNVKAEKIEKVLDRESCYRMVLSNDRIIEADHVILSTPQSSAQALLNDASLDEDFNQFLDSSMISVYLGFDIPDEELPVDGTGFIVADSDELLCNASTWTSRKWKHTSENGHFLVRMFYKSTVPDFERLIELSEEEIMRIALQDIVKSLGIEREPVTYEVTKWLDAMPNYHISHHQLVESLEAKIKQSYPGIYLAGCSYYGVGIPDCIANGKEVAEIIAEQLQG